MHAAEHGGEHLLFGVEAAVVEVGELVHTARVGAQGADPGVAGGVGVAVGQGHTVVVVVGGEIVGDGGGDDGVLGAVEKPGSLSGEVGCGVDEACLRGMVGVGNRRGQVVGHGRRGGAGLQGDRDAVLGAAVGAGAEDARGREAAGVGDLQLGGHVAAGGDAGDVVGGDAQSGQGARRRGRRRGSRQSRGNAQNSAEGNHKPQQRPAGAGTV